MLNNFKQSLFFTIQNAEMLDYLVYGWVILAFVCLLLIGIYAAIKWWWQIGFLIIFGSFIAVFVGFYYANLELNERFRKLDVVKIEKKQLEYSSTLVVDMKVKNSSLKELKICKIDMKFHTVSNNAMRSFANSLNPFITKTIIVKEPFYIGEQRDLNLVVNNFAFVDYNITTRSECF